MAGAAGMAVARAARGEAERGEAERGEAADGTGDAAAWSTFKRRFVLPEGRVVDTGNAGVSHTEGQGWGLLFAATFDDAGVFDRLWHWTQATLARPHDSLHRWRYRPGEPDPVADPNNASDGDLFIGLALLRAAERWRRPELGRAAAAIARATLGLLVTTVHGRTLLAPGVDGFRSDAGLVVNPSYYAFPALDALARLVPDPRWAALRRDGAALLAEGRFGAWALPPDWLLVQPDGALRPAPDHPPRYGYDAVRVPLYLAWGGIASPVLEGVARWAAHAAPPPAWVDLVDGQTAEYAAGPGMQAATALAIGVPVPHPDITDDMDYYTAALCLLTRVAARDITARRTAAGPR